jgi:uncharacterized protein YxeA
MKKALFILSIMLLCSATGAAQTIDKETFDKLVDYVNCKYTAAYIETFRNDLEKYRDDLEKYRDAANQAKADTLQKDLKLYDSLFKEKLEECTLDEHLSFEYLKQLEKNRWKSAYTNFTLVINEKKKQFKSGDNMPATKAIQLLTRISPDISVQGVKNRMPQRVIDSIKTELTEKYDKKTTNGVQNPTDTHKEINRVIVKTDTIVQEEIIEILKTDTIVQEEIIGIIKEKIVKEIKSNPWIWLICIIFFSPLILFFILLWRRSSNNRINKIIYPLLFGNKAEIEEIVYDIFLKYKDEIEKIQHPPCNENETGIKSEDIQDKENDKVSNKEEKSDEELYNPNVDNNVDREQLVQNTYNPAIKYVKRKQGKIVMQLSDSSEGCDFKIFNIRGNTAEFEFCGDKNALLRQYIFNDVCDVIETPSTPLKDIINVEPGTVELKNDTWVVTTPAKIKFT